MNKCKISNTTLSAYLDDELKQRLNNQVQLHIKECVYCQERLRLWTTVSLSLKQPGTEMKPELHTRIIDKIREQSGNNVIFIPTRVSVWETAKNKILFPGLVLTVTVLLLTIIPLKLRRNSIPIIEVLTPTINAIVRDNQTEFCARMKVDTSKYTIKVLLDKNEVTEATEIVDEFILFRPLNPLSDGYHTITVILLDDKTKQPVSETAFSFLVFSNNDH